jgi:PPK2 family polyphosphate:nucleotide phosphotransferase
MAMPNRTGRRLRDVLRVEPDTVVKLGRFDPSETYGRDKATSGDELVNDLTRLSALQDRVWAQATTAVLVVLQGIDTAGKDGTIRHVMSAFNPQGCPVSNFKVPSDVEKSHDYLWRVHLRTPAKGEIGIFNRSHYEDVLVVRVHGLVPKRVWSARFEQINAWERTLTQEGMTIVKFFLVIDREEQRARLQARLDDPNKRWKFKTGDIDERALWPSYTRAFEDCLSRTSTAWAPWYVIPANRKWFRNLAVAQILGDVLADLHPRYPKPTEDLSRIVIS